METVEQNSSVNTDKKLTQTIYVCAPNVDTRKIITLLSQKGDKGVRSKPIRRFIVIDGFNFDSTVMGNFHQFLGCQQPEGLRLPSDMTSFAALEENRISKTFELAKKGFGAGVCIIITSETEAMQKYVETCIDEKYNINVQHIEN